MQISIGDIVVNQISHLSKESIPKVLNQWFLTGSGCAPREHLPMPGITFDCPIWGRECCTSYDAHPSE